MTSDMASSANEPAAAPPASPTVGRPRFPESKEEKTARLARTVHQVGSGSAALESAQGGLPPVSILEGRIAQPLQATGDAVASAMALTLAADMAQEGHTVAQRFARCEITPADLTERSLANLEAVIRVISRPAWFVRKDVPQPGERCFDARRPVRDRFHRRRQESIVVGMQPHRLHHEAGGRRVCSRRNRLGIGERTVVTSAGHLAFRRPVVPAGDRRDDGG
jgi:hypothetical protein